MSLRSEILEQPSMLRSLAKTWSTDAKHLRDQLGEPEGVLLVGRGTSDNVARYGQYLLGIEHGLPSALATPSLYSAYRTRPAFPPDWLIVAVSQSGASPDLSAVVGAGEAAANLKIAVTNNPGSLLASVADIVMPLGAGDETAVAATKTYTASLCAMLRLSDALSSTDRRSTDLDATIRAVEVVLSMEEELAGAAAEVAGMESCAVIGRGLHMSTAFEWALKITETSSLAAVPFSSADFLHGPVAMIDQSRPLLAVVDDDPFTGQLIDIIDTLSRDEGTAAVVFSFLDAVPGSRVVTLPSVEPRLNPIVAGVALQLFTLHLARARGLDPDNPRGLSKVTETL